MRLKEHSGRGGIQLARGVLGEPKNRRRSRIGESAGTPAPQRLGVEQERCRSSGPASGSSVSPLCVRAIFPLCLRRRNSHRQQSAHPLLEIHPHFFHPKPHLLDLSGAGGELLPSRPAPLVAGQPDIVGIEHLRLAPFHPGPSRPGDTERLSAGAENSPRPSLRCPGGCGFCRAPHPRRNRRMGDGFPGFAGCPRRCHIFSVLRQRTVARPPEDGLAHWLDASLRARSICQRERFRASRHHRGLRVVPPSAARRSTTRVGEKGPNPRLPQRRGAVSGGDGDLSCRPGCGPRRVQPCRDQDLAGYPAANAASGDRDLRQASRLARGAERFLRCSVRRSSRTQQFLAARRSTAGHRRRIVVVVEEVAASRHCIRLVGCHCPAGSQPYRFSSWRAYARPIHVPALGRLCAFAGDGPEAPGIRWP